MLALDVLPAAAPAIEIGPDGHPQRGGFLPPAELPRRMWAESKLEFVRPLRIGSALSKRSTIADVSAKDGRTGPLVFVRVRHEVADELGVVLIEDQDVHGPLIATLLLDLLRRQRPDAWVSRFAFRAVKPLHDTATATLA